jgi:PDZ domain-containing protein
MRRLLTPGRLAAAGLVLLALVAGVLLLTPSDDTFIFLPDEAKALEPLVSVPGRKPMEDGGGFYLVDVLVRKATLMERIFPAVRDDGASLVPAHALNPTGLSEDVRRRANLREMTRSQRVAAAVALREAGFEVEAEPAGAFVSQVFPDAPAAGKLQPTDVVVAANGARVRTPGDLRDVLGRLEPGDEVTLDVRRGSERKQLRVGTIASSLEPGRALIGVLIEQAADIDLPLEVKIETGDVGGPSAGLAFALQLLEELGRDVDGGRRVAVTGELELDGDVQPVGGLKQKTIGARRTGVDVFIVPAGENAEEARRYADGLRIVPVRTFQQALRALATAAGAA